MAPEDAEAQTSPDLPESLAQDTWSQEDQRGDLSLPEDTIHVETEHQNIPVPSSLSDIPEADIISDIGHSTPDQLDLQVSTPTKILIKLSGLNPP
jgi:hypothetical protein